MSLPASQQRVLDAIDSDLRGADIRLDSMFSVFTQLTRLDKMPPAETYQPVRWWTRAGRARRARTGRRAASRLGTIVLIPLLLAATLSLLLLTMLTTRSTGPGRCGQTSAFMAPARLAAGGCAPGGQPRTSPVAG
jgi:hypothetical protein